MDIEDRIEEYYRLIGCDLIDIVSRTIGGKVFDLIVDDEGLLKENFITAAESRFEETKDFKGCDCLAGNIVITGFADEEGNLTSLTKEDVDLILKHIGLAGWGTKDGYTQRPLLIFD